MIRFLLVLVLSSFSAQARLIGIPALSCSGSKPAHFLLDHFEAQHIRGLEREGVPSRLRNPNAVLIAEHYLEKLSWDFPILAEALFQNLKKMDIKNRPSIQASLEHLDPLVKPDGCRVFAISALDIQGQNFVWYRTDAERFQAEVMDQGSILMQILSLTILKHRTSTGTRVFTGYLLSQQWNFLSLYEKKIIMRQVGFHSNWLNL